MPMPWTYRHASKEWRAILDDARDRMNLSSDNMAYTAIDAVFQVFRRRLSAQQGLDFASVLPAVPRAIFVAGWDVSTPPLPFADRVTLTAEVRAVRPDHNLTPDNAIEATAWTIWRYVNHAELDRVLNRLPEGARDFWTAQPDDPADLTPRIF